MKKIVISIILSLFLILKANIIVSADEIVAGESATLMQDSASLDYNVQILREFFSKNNSPLTPYAENFIKVAEVNKLDWRLIPAITGVESTYGKNIPANSYNAYGWANGNYSFNSWEESISIVAEALRNKYLNRGYIAIYQIARIYAPPSSTWAGKVRYIMNNIYPFPVTFDL